MIDKKIKRNKNKKENNIHIVFGVNVTFKQFKCTKQQLRTKITNKPFL